MRSSMSKSEPIGSWSPLELAIVQEIDLRSTADEGATLDMVALFQRRVDGGWPDWNQPMRRLRLRFEGIKDLHLSDFSSNTQIMGFDLSSVQDRGLEGISFQVQDFEDHKIGFCCKSFCLLQEEEEDFFVV